MISKTPADSARLAALEAAATYARQRRDLYKARAYGPRPTSESRMRELERQCSHAEAALRFARNQIENPG